MEKLNQLLKNRKVVQALVALIIAGASAIGYVFSPEVANAIQILMLAIVGA